MERVVDSTEVHEEAHYLEQPLKALLDNGHVVFGQDDNQYAAFKQAAVFLHGQEKETHEAIAGHPLVLAIASHIETESTKEGFDLARMGWQRTLTFIKAAMVTEDPRVKDILGRIEAKYVQ